MRSMFWCVLLGLMFVAVPLAACEGAELWYRDADLDGRGNPDLPRLSCANLWPLWVQDATDCDDSNILVFDLVTDLVPDCDTDGYADSVPSTSACVGALGVKYYFCGLSLCARNGYYDAGGGFWITAASAQKDGSGALILDSSPGCPLY